MLDLDTPATSTPIREPLAAAVRRRPERLQRHRHDPVRQLAVAHLSFEGPDAYSSAGGLGVRVTNLADAFAEAGCRTSLHFVGDPDLPTDDQRGAVTLRRWCQSISAHAPAGVYDAEEEKIADLCRWWPLEMADRIGADRAVGRHTLVLAEDWHTVWPLIALHDELTRRGARHAATLAWTANNRFGFDRIDFARLAAAARIVTISRAMKHLMWSVGVNPVVVPNGLPPDAFVPVDAATRRVWEESLAGVTTFAKVGRWDPDKRWHMAVDSVAELARRSERAVLLARGWNGNPAAAAHADELRRHAARLGLDWTRCETGSESGAGLAKAIRRAIGPNGGVVEITSPLDGEPLRALYAGADVVLANSGFEPFGLVGLEAMATGAIVFTGSTGEDYVQPFVNGVALDTEDPREIVRDLDWLRRRPRRAEAIGRHAVDTAGRFRWSGVIERLGLALGVSLAP